MPAADFFALEQRSVAEWQAQCWRRWVTGVRLSPPLLALTDAAAWLAAPRLTASLLLLLLSPLVEAAKRDALNAVSVTRNTAVAGVTAGSTLRADALVRSDAWPVQGWHGRAPLQKKQIYIENVIRDRVGR